jgi:hypothetical protein
MNPPGRTDSDQFEKDLDEFFKDRAEFRSCTFTDSSKSKTSTERTNETVAFDPTQMSGCCMTGCYDCPWDYKSS